MFLEDLKGSKYLSRQLANTVSLIYIYFIDTDILSVCSSILSSRMGFNFTVLTFKFYLIMANTK